MENTNKKEILEFFDDTSKLLSKIAVVIGSNSIADGYVDNVELWQRVSEIFPDMGLNSAEDIAEHFLNKEGFRTQVHGVVYEIDWTNAERGKLSNLFSQFELPGTHNNPGIDVIEKSLFGGTEEYQLKGYTGGGPTINTDTTPFTTTVVTNAENIEGVEKQGFDTETFMDNESILDRREDVFDIVNDGDATPVYEFGDVAETMGKGALFGIAIGIGTEAFSSYRDYKSGKIDAKEYAVRITKAGADKGITAGATTGIMIPINAVLTSTLMTSIISIPVAFLVHHAIAQPVSAAFGRGEYKTILNEARIYDSSAEMMTDFGIAAGETSRGFRKFIADGMRTNREFVERRDNFNDSLNDLVKKIGGKL